MRRAAGTLAQSGPVSVAYTARSLQLNVSASGQSVWSNRALARFLCGSSVGGRVPPMAIRASSGRCVGATSDPCTAWSSRRRTTQLRRHRKQRDRVLDTHDELVSTSRLGGQPRWASSARQLERERSGWRRHAPTGRSPSTRTSRRSRRPSMPSSLYAEADRRLVRVDVDRAAAYGIPGSAEGMTSEGESLLTHVPATCSRPVTRSLPRAAPQRPFCTASFRLREPAQSCSSSSRSPPTRR